MADRSITVRLRAVVSDFNRAMGEASRTTQKFGRDVARLGRENAQDLTTVGLAAAGAGVAIAGGFGMAAKAAVDWESAFAGVRKTVDGTERELAGLEQGLRKMATEIPIPHEELAGIAEAAGQLGIETPNILEFTKTMAMLGVTTNLTSEQAATSFARISNVMMLPQDQFDEMGSTVVALGNNLATTEAEVVDFATRLAGAGQVAGFATADVLGISAAMSSVGVEAEAGGTAVQKVMLGMAEAVASGSDDLEVFARTAGLSAAEFATMWEDDAAGAFTLFVEGLGRSGQDAFQILEELGLQDQRLIRAFLSLAAAGDTLRGSLDLANESWVDNLALSKEAKERFKTVASQLQTAKNSLVEMGIAIGEIVLPVLVPLIGAVKDAAVWFAGLPGPVKTAGVALAGISGSFLLVAGTAALVLPRIVALIDAWRKLKAAIIGAQIAAGAAGVAGGAGAGVRTVAGLGSFTLTTGAGIGVGGAAAAAGAAAIPLAILAATAALAGKPLDESEKAVARRNPRYDLLEGILQGPTAVPSDAVDDLAAAHRQRTEGMTAWMAQSRTDAENLAEALGVSTEAASLLLGETDGLGGQISEELAEARQAATEFRDTVISEFDAVISLFADAPNQIESSLEEMRLRLEAQMQAQAMFWSNLSVLAAAGLDNVVAELRGKGPAAAEAAQELVDNMDEALALDEMLQDAEDKAPLIALALANSLTLTEDMIAGPARDLGAFMWGQMKQGFGGEPLPVTFPGGHDYGRLSGRAEGGPVIAGHPYLVGEQQPELFVPGTSGHIYTAEQLSRLADRSRPTAGSQGDVSIVIQNPQSDDLAGDIQRGLLLAGVTRMVEVS